MIPSDPTDARSMTRWSVPSMSSRPGLCGTGRVGLLLGLAATRAGEPPAAAAGDLSLEVRVVGIDGKPVERSSVSVWRLVPEAEHPEKAAGGRGPDLWREAGS